MTTRLVSITATRAVELLAQLVRKQLLPVPAPDRWCEVDIGAAGAPTLDAESSSGVASVASGGTFLGSPITWDGAYTLTLSDPTTRITGLQVSFSGAGDGQPTGVPAAPVVGILGRTEDTVTFQCSDTTGVHAFPSDGEVMVVRVFCED